MADPDDLLTDDDRLAAPRRRPPPRRNGPGRWLTALVLLLGAVSAGVYFAQRERAAAPAPAAADAGPAQAAEAPPPAHPIEAVVPEMPREADAPLPALADSDAEVLAALAALLGLDDPTELFVPRHLVPRIVATIDNLPERRLATRILPLKPVPGALEVASEDGRTVLSAANAARYARHVQLLEAADTDALVGAYVRHYPLFQQAYRELGYPDGHFNDRLVQVIDHLLAAPEVAPVLALRQEKAGWAYADEALEQSSAGHRLLFRLGPDNAARVKAKLRELRAAIASRELSPA